MTVSRAIQREVVQKYLHNGRDVLTEYLRNDTLERGRRGFQPKHDNYRDEHAPFCYERCFLLIVMVYADLVIPAETIQETLHLMPYDGVQHVVRKR